MKLEAFHERTILIASYRIASSFPSTKETAFQPLAPLSPKKIMRKASHWIIALAPVLLLYVSTASSLLSNTLNAQEPLLKPNDRVAVLGGTLVERMQSSGALELELQTRRPEWKLKIRNLGWSGDDVHGLARKVFDNPEAGFKRMIRDVETADPTVVLIAYGFAEASDGAAAVDRFEAGLNRLLDQMKQQKRRIILLSPFAMPGIRTPGYDQSMSRCQQIVASVGAARKIPVLVSNWVPQASDVTEDGLHPSPAGFKSLAQPLAKQLVGGSTKSKASQSLQAQIVSKNQLFFHRYRPQNETYLFLFRKHEQGNNASEIPEFDPLIDAADQQIWAAAK